MVVCSALRGRVAVRVHVSYPAFVRVNVHMFALADQPAQHVHPKRDQHPSDHEFDTVAMPCGIDEPNASTCSRRRQAQRYADTPGAPCLTLCASE